MKKALITGLTGQDGSYLAEELLVKNYEVHGTSRSKGNTSNIEHMEGKLKHFFINNTQSDELAELIKIHQYDEIYHLAAITFIPDSPKYGQSLMEINFLPLLTILETIKNFSPKTKLFFSSSSEVFGNVDSFPQNELTPKNPRNMYGLTKSLGMEIINFYRESYNIFACSGLLFNHESERRGVSFVTRKITHQIARIKFGLQDCIELGNLDAQRDWSYAPDFVKAFHLILSQPCPDDFVLGSGESHTIREFLNEACSLLDLDYEKYYVKNPLFFRDAEKVPLIADPSKAKKILNWQTTTNFKEIVHKMVLNDVEILRRP